jgi:hypothetical protein
MSDDIVYQVLLQRIEDIQSSMKDVREAQVIAARDSRETAIKLERVLGKIDEFSKMADTQRQMEQTIVNLDIRLEMLEVSAHKPSLCDEKEHEQRIGKMERSHAKFVTASIAAIIVINIMLAIAKELM